MYLQQARFVSRVKFPLNPSRPNPAALLYVKDVLNPENLEFNYRNRKGTKKMSELIFKEVQKNVALEWDYMDPQVKEAYERRVKILSPEEIEKLTDLNPM